QVGSTRADVGHTGAAAGLASFVKACLYLGRAAGPRRAGVNSQGEGSCVHVILEGWEAGLATNRSTPQPEAEAAPAVQARSEITVAIGGGAFDVPLPLWGHDKPNDGGATVPTPLVGTGLALAAEVFAPQVTRAAEVRQAAAEAHQAYLRF